MHFDRSVYILVQFIDVFQRRVNVECHVFHVHICNRSGVSSKNIEINGLPMLLHINSN